MEWQTGEKGWGQLLGEGSGLVLRNQANSSTPEFARIRIQSVGQRSETRSGESKNWPSGVLDSHSNHTPQTRLKAFLPDLGYSNPCDMRVISNYLSN